jgi:NTE family protein
MAESTDKRVALVIGSGAIKCACAIGVYEVLTSEGILVDLVVGCSAGSIYAAVIALGYSPREAEEKTIELWTQEITRQRSRKSILQVILPQLVKFDNSFGLLDDSLILSRLRTAFETQTIEDAQIPLFIVATDFENGEKVVLERGAIVDAIRASLAIPFVFSPWRVDGRLLMDGFMSDPLPVDVAIKEQADIILAVGFESPYQYKVNSAAKLAFQVTTVAANNLLRSNYAFHNLAHHAEVIPIIPEFEERIKAFDVSKLPLIVEKGRECIRQELPYLRQLVSGA